MSSFADGAGFFGTAEIRNNASVGWQAKLLLIYRQLSVPNLAAVGELTANRAADPLFFSGARVPRKLATSTWECNDLEPEVQNQPQLVQLLIRALAGVVLVLVIGIETDVLPNSVLRTHGDPRTGCRTRLE